MKITDIYRTFHSKTVKHAFLAAHKTFLKIDWSLDHKANFNRYKKDVISYISSRSQWNELEIENKRKYINYKNNLFLNNQI